MLLLYTSGTTAAPRAAVLRHRHLSSYVIGTVEFGAADPDDAVLAVVPPYHIAGVMNLLSNLYLGRRIVYLDAFGAPPDVKALRSLSYGGARMPAPVIDEALRLFPCVGFTNAYGLTETSSTISVLGTEEHRAAHSSSDPLVRARMQSAGLPLPGVEIAVVGLDDQEWGQRIAAAVVLSPGAVATPEALQDFAREHLRTSKSPDVVVLVESLPYTDTGKLVRRAVRERLLSAESSSPDAQRVRYRLVEKETRER